MSIANGLILGVKVDKDWKLSGITKFASYLNEKQRKDAENFIRDIPRANGEEEDCCGTACYHFELTPSGIGDTIYIVCGENRLWLDDGLEP